MKRPIEMIVPPLSLVDLDDRDRLNDAVSRRYVNIVCKLFLSSNLSAQVASGWSDEQKFSSENAPPPVRATTI